MKEIIAKELVSFSGQTFSDSKEAYEYINKMLKRVQEATKQEIVEEIEKMIKINNKWKNEKGECGLCMEQDYCSHDIRNEALDQLKQTINK